MDETSAVILKRYFKEYYFKFNNKIKAPPEIESREFGYLPFSGGMIRHLGFKEIGSFRALLVKEAPAGVYCSNSHYQDPTLEMHLKGWLKAELIFDIDAGSLNQPCKKEHDIWLCKNCGRKEFGLRPETCPDCKSNRLLELPWVCRSCLEASKQETLKLIEFLELDFGVSPSKIKSYFSGSAGYHVEVQSSDYEILGSRERGELVDYLTAQGLVAEAIKSSRLLPSDPGWRGRIARMIRDLPAGTKWFKSNAYEARVNEFVNDFSKKKGEEFLAYAAQSSMTRIDPMVTTDVHRIFRMPETLNNKTALVKRECNDIVAFDPSIEAIALVGDAEKAHVAIDMCPKIELGGVVYGPFHSVTRNLPRYAAAYLVAKGAARFVIPEEMSGIRKASTL